MKKLLILAGVALISAACVKNIDIVEPGTSELKGVLVLNEINGAAGTGTDAEKYIELYNNGDEEIDLHNFTITYGGTLTWTGTTHTIAAHGFLVLQGTKGSGDMSTGLSANNAPWEVALYDSDGNKIDVLTKSEDTNSSATLKNKCFQRIPNGTGSWYYTDQSEATKGTANPAVVSSTMVAMIALPMFENKTISPAAPTSTDEVTISAKITDGEAITSVVLTLTIGAGTPAEHTLSGVADVYSHTVAAQADGTVVSFTITATNTVGNTASWSSSYTVADAVVDYTKLVINEIDGNGKFIELYNKGAVAIPLAGVYLVKNESGSWWTGAAGNGEIAAGGFVVITQSDADPLWSGASGISPKQNLKFQLFDPANTQIDLFIRTNGGAWGDAITPDYGSGTQYSFSRCPDGTGTFGLAAPSKGTANPATAVGPIVTDGSGPDYTKLVINEIDGNGKFIELYNKGAVALSLTGVVLVKNESGSWWTGAAGNGSIAAGGYAVITNGDPDPLWNGGAGISPKQNLKFELQYPAGTTIDTFLRSNGGALGAGVTPDYGSGTQYSFSRCPDGTGTFGLAAPSKGTANPATAVGPIVTNP